MRKTSAGKLMIGLVDVAFLIVAGTAIVSLIPPQYDLSNFSMSPSLGSSGLQISMSYTVTNNGFYAIGNLYGGVTVVGPQGEIVSQNWTTPRTIQRGESFPDVITVVVNQTYLDSHHGNATMIRVTIRGEFARGLLKLTIDVPTPYILP